MKKLFVVALLCVLGGEAHAAERTLPSLSGLEVESSWAGPQRDPHDASDPGPRTYRTREGWTIAVRSQLSDALEGRWGRGSALVCADGGHWGGRELQAVDFAAVGVGLRWELLRGPVRPWISTETAFGVRHERRDDVGAVAAFIHDAAGLDVSVTRSASIGASISWNASFPYAPHTPDPTWTQYGVRLVIRR